jgi:hypothetical protein
MRKLIIAVIFTASVAAIGWAADIDRHASFTDPKTPDAAAQCKGFYGSDDNLTACNDFCSNYRTQNEGAKCGCEEGKCASDDH